MRIDFREYFDCVFQQGTVSSCTAEALAMICYFTMKRDGFPFFIVSSLFIYYNTRMMMGTEAEDTGSTIAEAIGAIQEFGVCPESMWPFRQENVLQKPPDSCYDFGRSGSVSITHITPITDWDGIIRSLSHRRLLLCSIIRTEGQSIDPATAFIIPRLDTPHKSYLHSIIIVGVLSDDTVIIMDSKGSSQGRSGFFYMHRKDLFDLATDIHEIDISISMNRPLPPLRIPSPSPLSHYFDAIVVGAGIAGAFTAYRLATMGKRVLVVDDGRPKSVGTISRMGMDLNLSAYRFSPRAHPILASLVAELGLPVADLPVINNMLRELMSRPVVQKFVHVVLDEFGDEGVFTTAYRQRILSTLPSSMSTDEFLRERGFSDAERREFETAIDRHDPGFCFDSVGLPASQFINHILSSTQSDFVAIADGGFGRLIDKCLEGFHRQTMPLLRDDLRFDNIRHLILEDCSMSRGCSWDEASFVLRPSDGGSDLIIPTDGTEIFWTGRRIQPPGCPPILTIPVATMCMFFDEPLSSIPDYSHVPLWGRILRLNDRAIRIRCYNETDTPRILQCIPGIIPTIVYSCDGFPDLMNLLETYPLDPTMPSSFVMTCDGSDFGHVVSDGGPIDYAGVMTTAIRPTDRIHYINSNYSTLYGWIEGALEMAEYACVA